VCGYWTFITYWTWVGAYFIYGNQGLRDCWLANKEELMPLIRMSQAILLFDFFVMFFWVMILPVVLQAFYKVLRQRIRIWSFERSQATQISEPQIVQATSACDMRSYLELKTENEADPDMVDGVCMQRCAICMSDFDDAD